MHYVLGFGFSDTVDEGLGDTVSCLLHFKTSGPAHARGFNAFGGAIKEGETPSMAICREYKEETGIEVPFNRWKPFYQGHTLDNKPLMDCFVTELSRGEVGKMTPTNDKGELNVEIFFYVRKDTFNLLTPLSGFPGVAPSIAFLLPMAYHFLHDD